MDCKGNASREYRQQKPLKMWHNNHESLFFKPLNSIEEGEKKQKSPQFEGLWQKFYWKSTI